MIKAFLSNGWGVFIKTDIKTFLNEQERGVWLDAETDDHLPLDRVKLKINSLQVVAIKDVSNS